jgi:hypothetical protein
MTPDELHRSARLAQLAPSATFGATSPDEPWVAADYSNPASYVQTLSTAEWRELVEESRCAFIGTAGSHSALSALGGQLLERLENGRGFAVLRGVPIDELSAPELEQFLLAFCSHLGRPVPQTREGTLLCRVEDSGLDNRVGVVRGHKTRAALTYHCDRCDLIGMLCIRKAAWGGESLLASAVAVYDELERIAPWHLAELTEQLPHDCRDEQRPGEPPWTLLPVFSPHEQRFVSRYIRRFIESAERFPDAPRLTPGQRGALDFLDAMLETGRFGSRLTLEPGDLQLINNYTVWHGRTEFHDHDHPLKRRLMLRVWLSSHRGRALPESYRPIYGAVGARALRGGVVAVEPPGVMR